jgi:3-methyladenine DNA glycosylase Tag
VTCLPAWLAGLAAVPALGLLESKNSRFEAQLFQLVKVGGFHIGMLSKSTIVRQKGKIVATIQAKRTVGHFVRVSTGFYWLL